jgi:hypothetical protein
MQPQVFVSVRWFKRLSLNSHNLARGEFGIRVRNIKLEYISFAFYIIREYFSKKNYKFTN